MKSIGRHVEDQKLKQNGETKHIVNDYNHNKCHISFALFILFCSLRENKCSRLLWAATAEDAGGVTQAWNECGNQPGRANK